MRAFTFLNVYSDASNTNLNTFDYKLGIGGEYPFLKGSVNPYVGALLCFEVLSLSNRVYMDYHLGGMIGVEIKILDFVTCYVEYKLLITFTELGTEVDLAKNHLPAIGLIFFLAKNFERRIISK